MWVACLHKVATFAVWGLQFTACSLRPTPGTIPRRCRSLWGGAGCIFKSRESSRLLSLSKQRCFFVMSGVADFSKSKPPVNTRRSSLASIQKKKLEIECSPGAVYHAPYHPKFCVKCEVEVLEDHVLMLNYW